MVAVGTLGWSDIKGCGVLYDYHAFNHRFCIRILLHRKEGQEVCGAPRAGPSWTKLGCFMAYIGGTGNFIKWAG